MYHLKTTPDINQLQLHLQNLSTQVNKIIVENNQVNHKMYNYNFQKVSLKLHKYTVDFIQHLTIKETLYNSFQSIKSLTKILTQSSKNRKARSSRTYLDDQSFGKFTSSSKFDNSSIADDDIDDQQEIDLIQQFMIKRNHQIQSNVFGDVDQGFKTRQRKGLQDFLSHADIHAKNLQFQLKNSSQQRNKMSNSFRLGGLTKNKLLFKKQTFDLERINQMSQGIKDFSGQTISEGSQTTQKQVQTIFTGENIKWNKILTYCLNRSVLQSQIEGEQRKQLFQIFDKQIFGQIGQIRLQDGQVQTQSNQDKTKEKQIQISKTTLKLDAKRQISKNTKRVMQKGSNIKGNKTKQNQSKANSVHTKTNQKQTIQIANISNIQNQIDNQNKIIKLQLECQTWQYCVSIQSPKLPTTTTFEALGSPSKKSMKTLQQKQMIFQFTSKKQLNKRAGVVQVIRSHKKNKSLVGYSLSAQKSEEQSRQTDKQIDIEKKIQHSDSLQEEEITYETTVNIEEGLVRRKFDRKNTWKGSDSSNSILKSTSKLNQLKSDQTLYNDNQLPTRSYNVNDIKYQHNDDMNSTHYGKKSHIHRRTSNFKQMYGSNTPDNSTIPLKKPIFNKRNTLDTLIGNNQIKSQMAPFMLQFNFKKDQNIKNNFIQEQEFEASYRNTQQDIQFSQQNQNSLRINKNFPLQTSTRKNQKPLQSHHQQHIQESHRQTYRQPHTANMAYKNPSKQKKQSSSKRQVSTIKQKSHKKLRKNIRVKTVQKQNEYDIKQIRVQRNSATFHEINNSHKILAKPFKKTHNKYNSQQLPGLQGCKQKLSDIKRTMIKQGLSKTASTNDFTVSNLQKQISGSISSPNNELKTLGLNKLSTSNERMNLINYHKNDEQNITKTLRKLFMTNSYRDKLLLYLSMIEVTHEKYCGKNCEHVNKFIRDMTGGIQVAEQSVAKQLLKLYNTKSSKFQGGHTNTL